MRNFCSDISWFYCTKVIERPGPYLSFPFIASIPPHHPANWYSYGTEPEIALQVAQEMTANECLNQKRMRMSTGWIQTCLRSLSFRSPNEPKQGQNPRRNACNIFLKMQRCFDIFTWFPYLLEDAKMCEDKVGWLLEVFAQAVREKSGSERSSRFGRATRLIRPVRGNDQLDPFNKGGGMGELLIDQQ